MKFQDVHRGHRTPLVLAIHAPCSFLLALVLFLRRRLVTEDNAILLLSTQPTPALYNRCPRHNGHSVASLYQRENQANGGREIAWHRSVIEPAIEKISSEEKKLSAIRFVPRRRRNWNDLSLIEVNYL